MSLQNFPSFFLDFSERYMKGENAHFYGFGRFTLDVAEQRLSDGDSPIPLTPKAFNVLSLLVQNAGHLVEKEELMQHVWPDSFVEESNVARIVHTLRKKLGDDGNGNSFIETIPTRGYRFVAEIEQATNAKQPQDSVAVLPFENKTGRAELDYLSDGFSETLIDDLSKFSELKVIARYSSFQYRGLETDLIKLSKELGVRTIITGKLASAEGNLIIRAELNDASENRQLWSETYTLQITEIQSVQLKVVKMISETLRLGSARTSKIELNKSEIVHPEAYQHYLSGLFVARTSLRRSLDYFIRATALDQNFSLAFYRLGQIYFYLGYNTELNPLESGPKACQALQRALELDGTLAGAYQLRAHIRQSEWDWNGAESDLTRVVEIDPNTSEAHEVKAELLAAAGRIEEAVNELRLWQRLDPLSISPRFQQGRIFYYARQYDDAIRTFQDIVQLAPDHSDARIWLGTSYSAKGGYQQAIAEYQLSLQLKENAGTSVDCYFGYALARAGKRQAAITLLKKLMATKEYVSRAHLAILYIGLGDKTAAFESLEQAYDERDGQLQNLVREPRYDDLRNDPRFSRLLEHVGVKLPTSNIRLEINNTFN